MADTYIAQCRKAFAALKAQAEEGLPAYRISVLQQDGGAFHKDFTDMQDALRMFNANVRYGSPMLVAAFIRTKTSGWSMVAQYPHN